MPSRDKDIDETLDIVDFYENDGVDVEDEGGSIANGLSDFDNDNGILLHNDKKYAVNIIWLLQADITSNETVYKKAKSIGADFYCNRSFVDQSGYSSLKKKHKMGMVSVAAAAADSLIGEWHGVFKADNGWLYIAVHADMIAPDGDKFFVHEEDAYNHFIEESEKFKWPKRYAPEHWDIKINDGEVFLDQILSDVSFTTLKPVGLDALFGGTANKNLALGVGVILLGLFIFYIFSQAMFSSLVPTREIAARPGIAISENLIAPPRLEGVRDHPVEMFLQTEQILNPTKFMNACIESFDNLMVSIPGWNISAMKCRGNFSEAIWNKGVGSLEILRNYIGEFPFGVNKTYGSNGDFLASQIIQMGSFAEAVTLSNRENAILSLNQKFSSLSDLQVRDITPQPINTQQLFNSEGLSTEPVAPPVTFDSLPALQVSMTSDLSPTNIKQNFNLPGLKFNYIEWDLKTGRWTYDYTIYLYPDDYQPNKTTK